MDLEVFRHVLRRADLFKIVVVYAVSVKLIRPYAISPSA